MSFCFYYSRPEVFLTRETEIGDKYPRGGTGESRGFIVSCVFLCQDLYMYERTIPRLKSNFALVFF